MSLSFSFSRVRLSGRIVGAAVLLLALSVTELCSAAEMTFGGNCSLQLPSGWTAKPGKDNALIGEKPGEVAFNANAFATKELPEEIMERGIGLTEKKAGYKLIEKGLVKNTSRRKAHLFRFQLDGEKGRVMGVNYYFQVAENQVVLLVFWVADGLSKSPKSEIEDIFDSVKLATAAGAEDSWLTAPAEKPNESSKVTGSQDASLAGTYVMEKVASNYIVLKADGTLSGQGGGAPLTGTYIRDGAVIRVKINGQDATFKLDKETLIDPEGKRWVKKP